MIDTSLFFSNKVVVKIPLDNSSMMIIFLKINRKKKNNGQYLVSISVQLERNPETIRTVSGNRQG